MRMEMPDCRERQPIDSLSRTRAPVLSNAMRQQPWHPSAGSHPARPGVRRIRRRSRLRLASKPLLWHLASHRSARRLACALILVLIASLALAGWNGVSPRTGLLAFFSGSRSDAGRAGLEPPALNASESAALALALSLSPGSHDDDILPGEAEALDRSRAANEDTAAADDAAAGTAVSPAGTVSAAANVTAAAAGPAQQAFTSAGNAFPAALTAAPAASPAVGSKAGPSAAPSAAPELFPGIADSVTRHWTFPMKCSPATPAVGVFGANRGSRLHAGIDLYAPAGTEIFAMTAGRIRSIEVFYQGLMAIDIENDDGTTIRYGEMVQSVQVGDRVERGQLLGRLKRNHDGTCMLHLEIYASVRPDDLTQTGNVKDYPLISVHTRSFRRRSDLVNPGAVYTLSQP